ncbi:hypothetical protein HYV74_04130 [Candidatus Uhrbacteria bacterium]|nr:hypothetical protein [Candidatus Uhrbacteria bacterium]
MVDVLPRTQQRTMLVRGVIAAERVRERELAMIRAQALLRSLRWCGDAPFLLGFLGMPFAVCVCVIVGPFLSLESLRVLFAISVTLLAYSVITMLFLRYCYYPRGCALIRELDQLIGRSGRVQCAIADWGERDPCLVVRLSWWRAHAAARAE